MKTTNDQIIRSWMAKNLNSLSDAWYLTEATLEIDGVKIPINLNLSDKHIQNLLKNSVTYKAFKSFFSWKTCDTNESIPNIFASDLYSGRTIYLLQPGGKPIEEPHYMGYGKFGGKSVYAWLAEMNLPFTRAYSEEEKIEAGKQLLNGSYFENTKTGDKWMYKEAFDSINIQRSLFPGIDLLAMQSTMSSDHYTCDYANTMEIKFSSIYPIYYPLKFSYDEYARYEDFSASEVCPFRGIVYSKNDRYVNDAECWDLEEEFPSAEVLYGDRYFIRDIYSPRYFLYELDKSVCEAIIPKTGLESIPSFKRNDVNDVIEAVRIDGSALQYMSDEMKDNRYVVTEAIKNDNVAFFFASRRLKNDRDIVRLAIQCGPYNLFEDETILEIYNDDETIASLAIKKNGDSFRNISDRLKANREFVLEHIKYFRDIMWYVSEELSEDKEIALEAVKHHFWAYEDLPKYLLEDRDILLEAVKNDGAVLMYENLCGNNDREIVYEAIKSNREAFIYASEELQAELQEIVRESGNQWRETIDKVLREKLSIDQNERRSSLT